MNVNTYWRPRVCSSYFPDGDPDFERLVERWVDSEIEIPSWIPKLLSRNDIKGEFVSLGESLLQTYKDRPTLVRQGVATLPTWAVPPISFLSERTIALWTERLSIGEAQNVADKLLDMLPPGFMLPREDLLDEQIREAFFDCGAEYLATGATIYTGAGPFRAANNWNNTSHGMGYVVLIAPYGRETYKELLTQNVRESLRSEYERGLLAELCGLDAYRRNGRILEPRELRDGGLWEFAVRAAPGRGEQWDSIDLAVPVVARDPQDDVVAQGAVGIDFGTKSTVVVVKGSRHDDRPRPLRIGVQNLAEPVRASHYENPTLVEFKDVQRLSASWKAILHRPWISWADLRISHEALASLKEHERTVVQSIMPYLKWWPVPGGASQVRLVDQTGFELLLDSQAVKARIQAHPEIREGLGEDYPLDPIELYAFHLGLAINSPEEGIYLKYHLSFPVNYPAEAVNQILHSFQRGLFRSLPEALRATPSIVDRFRVTRAVAEPAAYAVTALTRLKIGGSSHAVRYAVFDFGGGTTDFDFGIFRPATAQEQDEDNLLHVVEHFGPNGDLTLGGERILELLAYHVIQLNRDYCLRQGLTFAIPPYLPRFAGDEPLREFSAHGRSNFTSLMEGLREFWESASVDSFLSEDSKLHVQLYEARAAVLAGCELVVNWVALDEVIGDRIQTGIDKFFTSMQQAFAASRGAMGSDQVHILLAGNACRSRHIEPRFNETIARFRKELDLTEAGGPVLHPPLPDCPDDPAAPNGKTGVAFGIVATLPGEGIRVVSEALFEGQAPFHYYVGVARPDRRFFSRIPRNTRRGEWIDICSGKPETIKLFFTTDPRAAAPADAEGIPVEECPTRIIQFDGEAPTGTRLFGRVVSHDAVEFVRAASVEAATAGAHEAQVVHFAH